MKFSLGDKVRWGENVGVIVRCTNDECIGIDFGVGFRGHNLDGAIKRNTGWYVNFDYLELAKESNRGSY